MPPNTPKLDSILEDIEKLKEGCRLLEDIRRACGDHYDFRNMIELWVKQKNLSREEYLKLLRTR